MRRANDAFCGLRIWLTVLTLHRAARWDLLFDLDTPQIFDFGLSLRDRNTVFWALCPN